MKRFLKYFALVIIVISLGCTTQTDTIEVVDPLASWVDGDVKNSVLSFVEEVTDRNSPDFIQVADRIAVFDNDGTLWSEQPLYFQLFFAIDRVKTLAPEHPEWSSQQPFQSILENDMEKFASFGVNGILEIVMATHAGNTTEEFDEIVNNWINTAEHPTLNRPYKELVYQPMLELVDFLRTNDFKVFIVSGGGIDFMRPWAEGVYGIPKDQIIGSSIKSVFEMTDDGPVIRKIAELDFIDDKEDKPVAIHKFIGRRPVFCAGNSDGDLAMMQWTDGGSKKSFKLYIHHTDADREWAYDRESHIGKFDKGLDYARENGWSVVDMAKDWQVVYPFELKSQN